VTQFYRGAQILRGFDDEARGLIAEMMREKGVDLHLGTNIVDMAPAGAGRMPRRTRAAAWARRRARRSAESRVATGRPGLGQGLQRDEAVYDAVLFATGRTPNTDGMGLEEAGVEVGRRGEVVVDEYSQTAVPSIYAIGDVTNRVNLTPVAIREGMAFVETVFKGNPTPVDHDLIPSAVFTQPEFGTVGLSEEEARDQEPVEVYCTSFRPMQSAFAGRPDRVLMKLVVSKATRRFWAVTSSRPQAGEMIQLAGIAVKMGATKEDFDRTVAVHPDHVRRARDDEDTGAHGLSSGPLVAKRTAAGAIARFGTPYRHARPVERERNDDTWLAIVADPGAAAAARRRQPGQQRLRRRTAWPGGPGGPAATSRSPRSTRSSARARNSCAS
jgi:glutathione reductase (NADPH)